MITKFFSADGCCSVRAQVYVSASKKGVLDALGLPPEYASLLTTDDRAARLHAVPLWRVRLKHMARALRHYAGRFTTVVGFQPTGWCMRTGAAAIVAFMVLLVLRYALTCCPCGATSQGEQAHERERRGRDNRNNDGPQGSRAWCVAATGHSAPV